MGRFFFLLLIIIISSNTSSAARSYVHVVGSSTMFPLVSYAAEELGRKNRVRVPLVEVTGTSQGFKLFCSGVGAETPDVVTASRKISAAEQALCDGNNISDLLEIKIGYDGIIIANSKYAPKLDFSKMELFLGLSSHIALDDFIVMKNPNSSWTDVGHHFPDQKIEVYGPARDSGTYDSIINMIFLEPCTQLRAFRMKYDDNEKLKAVCSIIRDDGRFIEVGNDENLIVQKILRNPNILGIFGYSFLKNNKDAIQGNLVNGIEPTYENIANGKYVLTRPLYLYIKKQHLPKITLLKKFVLEITNEIAIGNNGYLISQGLIPLSQDDFLALELKVKEKLDLK